MKLQEYMIDVTRAAADEAFKCAKAVPADKLDWKPLDNGRSVLDQCQEMAMCPTWCLDIVSNKEQPEWNEESMAEIEKQKSQWTTVEACQEECGQRMTELFDYFRTVGDERLSEKKWLPYDGGRDFSMPEMMDYPRWNFTYHLGQISYIQTLYGDKEMH